MAQSQMLCNLECICQQNSDALQRYAQVLRFGNKQEADLVMM